jgi:hypothetical protein
VARKTKSEQIDGIAIAVFGFIMLSIINLSNAWFVMLGAGVAHGYWPVIPPVGYWATYLMLVAVSCIAGAIKGGMKVEKE